MDLNRAPFVDFPVSFSLGDIHFVCRPKRSARDAVIQRYGERGYDAILASTDPFVMVSASQSRVIIFILI